MASSRVNICQKARTVHDRIARVCDVRGAHVTLEIDQIALRQPFDQHRIGVKVVAAVRECVVEAD
jgi:hypothetical protein